MSSNKGKFQPAGIGMVPSRTKLGSFIRVRRLKLKIRQIQLAKRAGLDQTLISDVETGERTYLKDRQLEGLAAALHCNQEGLRKRMPVKPKAEPSPELRKLIRSRREELGMTLKQFAKDMDMTSQRAKYLESSESPILRWRLVKPLARVLELNPLTLFKFVRTPTKESKSKLGQLVRSRLKELAMSSGELATKMGVSRQFVDQIEFGQCFLSESDKTIRKLAQALKLDVKKLKAVRLKRRLKKLDNTNGLGGFLAARRLELNLSQREVIECLDACRYFNLSAYETGLLSPSTKTLGRLAKVLKCQIPTEMIPPPHVRKIRHRK